MNRASFLKFLAAPLLALVLKFLPKREKYWEGTVIRSRVNGVEGPSGVVSFVAGEDLREGDSVSCIINRDLAYATPDEESGKVFRTRSYSGLVLGTVLETAEARSPVLVALRGDNTW